MKSSIFLSSFSSAYSLLILSTLALATMDTSAKVIAVSVPLVMAIWLRFSVHSLLMVVLSASTRKRQMFSIKQYCQLFARGLLLLNASFMVYLSLRYFSVAEVTAVLMLAPLSIMAMAHFLLKEKITRLQVFFVCLGLVGVLMILRPFQAFELGMGWQFIFPIIFLLTVTLFHLSTVHVVNFTKPSIANFYCGLTCVLVLTPLVPWNWQSNLPVSLWMLILLGGVCSALGHYLMAKAYSKAEASKLSPFIYFQLLFAIMLGWIFFGNVPDVMALTGMAFIVVSGYFGKRSNKVA